MPTLREIIGLPPLPVKPQKKARKVVEKQVRALRRLEVDWVPINALRPNPYNPNRQSDHEFNLLKLSMREDGFTQPILAHAETKEIVDGEHRWRAAWDLGYTEVPVVWTDMHPAQMRISTFRHNRARGSEDIELSAEVLRDLRDMGALGWAQDSLKMDDLELSHLLDNVPAPEILAGTEYNEAWAPGRAEAVAAKKKQEEREFLEQDCDMFRIAAIFRKDDAALIKQVLGDKPADALLALCRQQLNGKKGV